MVAVPKQPFEKPLPLSQTRPGYVTPEEYLERERNAETRSEYHDGVIVAMAGASPQHTRVTVNLTRRIDELLDDTDCQLFSLEQRVWVEECNRYFYPDHVVVCGEPQFQTIRGVESLTNPTLIIEVLSDSTADIDRTDKMNCYQTLASLQAYILVAQDRPRIETYSRQANGLWQYASVSGLDSVLTLDAIGGELSLSRIYRNVPFPPVPNITPDPDSNEIVAPPDSGSN